MLLILHLELITMQLTPPQTPQSDDLDALRAGLSGYNLAMAGSHQREQIASFIKDEEGKVLGASSPTSSGAGCMWTGSG